MRTKVDVQVMLGLGYTLVETEDDHYVRLADESIRALSDSMGYVFLDILPWRKSSGPESTH